MEIERLLAHSNWWSMQVFGAKVFEWREDTGGVVNCIKTHLSFDLTISKHFSLSCVYTALIKCIKSMCKYSVRSIIICKFYTK